MPILSFRRWQGNAPDQPIEKFGGGIDGFAWNKHGIAAFTDARTPPAHLRVVQLREVGSQNEGFDAEGGEEADDQGDEQHEDGFVAQERQDKGQESQQHEGQEAAAATGDQVIEITRAPTGARLLHALGDENGRASFEFYRAALDGLRSVVSLEAVQVLRDQFGIPPTGRAVFSQQGMRVVERQGDDGVRPFGGMGHERCAALPTELGERWVCFTALTAYARCVAWITL